MTTHTAPNYPNCGIVKDGEKLKMYVDDINLELTETQFKALTNIYSSMQLNIMNPLAVYVQDEEMHFLYTK